MSQPAHRNLFGDDFADMTIQSPITETRRRWVVLATILLVAIPIAYSVLKREVARWYHAAALEAIYSDDWSMALEKAQTGLEWNPNDLQLLNEAAGVHLRLTQATAAAEISDHALEIAENEYELFPSRASRMYLSQALNLSAYSHALDESELEESLKNVERAIELGGISAEGSIDTRGYIHYLLGNYEEAVKDTETAVTSFSKGVNVIKAQYRQNTQMFVDSRQLEYKIRLQDESMAILLQHRGLAYEAVGRTEEAERDFAKAEKLGFDPKTGVW